MAIDCATLLLGSALDELLILSLADDASLSATRSWVFSLVAHERRRYVLYLLQNRRVRNVEELTHQIAAWELEMPVERVPDADRTRIETSLRHEHLPKLADHWVVEYDPRSGDVVLCERADELEALLDVARDYDDMSSGPQLADD